MQRLLVVALFPIVIGWQPMVAQTPAQRVAWAQPVTPYRVVGDVWYVGGAGVSVFVIGDSTGLILLDGGLVEMAPQVAANIESLGFSLADVKVIVNSHAHHDHAGGIAELKRRTGAHFVASHGDAPALEAGEPDMPAVGVDRLIDHDDSVQVGKVAVRAHITPGHTPGCTTWTTTTTQAGQTYRVVFHCSTSLFEPLVGNTKYPAIADDYLLAFDRLREIETDVFLANHPGLMAMDEKLARRAAGAANPFVDPLELQRFVARTERDFRDELARQRAQR